MLVESSFSSSVESSLLNASEYQVPFAAYDWMSLAETYQMIHKLPHQSQVSFLDAVPVPDAMKLDESEHSVPPEKNVRHKVSSEKALTSLVYSRRKRSVRPGDGEDYDPGKCKKLDDSFDDSIVPVYNPGESSKRQNRFNNCLVYSRKKKRGETSSVIGETIRRADGIDDAFVSGKNCGETKGGESQLDVYLVYSRRKKGGVKSNSCGFSKHVSGGTNISGDQADSSEDSRRGQIVKADGGFTAIKNSGHRHLYSQSKPLVKSNGSFAECHTGGTKRTGDTSDGLLMYSRRKQRGKSIGGTRIDGFLVYRRKKTKANSISRAEQACRSLELKSVGARINGFLVYTRKKPKLNSISRVKQLSSSDGTNGSCSSQSISEFASGSSKKGENEATDSDSSDTDGSISPFRQCKRCDKAGTAEKMLICDECKEAYHPRCCRVRVKEAAEMDDWVCRSCLKKKSSKAKIKGRSRERKWRVTGPFVIGIRVGKEFQAEVPDWSGPSMSDTSFVGRPLEIDESEYMHDLKKAKNGKKPRSAENWLQCREEDRNGDICGKWRRAPRSEVQTNEWECFCSVFWDPLHADCAVPQELETDEIMQQLKYINMLRPRSDAKTQKTGPKGRSRSHK
ncbi:RING/FYVE/PHD zinc finger superfamily protein [Hirschfeldia incana]|nr:RING/FYVE/PHD zinc finger superfamily protein [Hirschfeldia incana]KAJ0254228.1 RING/FYVE/PHD zinc finger superfamily protein [Hirschfeldia incana]